MSNLPFPGQTSPFVGSGVPLKGVGPEHLREGAVGAGHLQPGIVGAGNLQDGIISLQHLAAALQAFLVPTGALIMWGNVAAPTGWLLCNGAAVSRTTEAALFAVYGTTYGVGDGTTTFNLPNLQQRFPLGKAAAGTGVNLGDVGGNIDHVHNLDTSNSHAKLDTDASPRIKMLRKTVASWTSTRGLTGAAEGAVIAATTLGIALGGDSAAANPPFQVVNFICKR